MVVTVRAGSQEAAEEFANFLADLVVSHPDRLMRVLVCMDPSNLNDEEARALGEQVRLEPIRR